MNAETLRDAKVFFLKNICGSGCLVVIDAQVSGVTGIPQRIIADKSQISLAFGYNLARPTDDIDVTDNGISATLAFGGEDKHVFIPWGAVLGMAPAVSVADRAEPVRPKARHLASV